MNHVDVLNTDLLTGKYNIFCKANNIILMANYCSRCGKRISKWFKTWYAQGNCSCLSIENKTIGTRNEEY
jgi:hypothetical protein